MLKDAFFLNIKSNKNKTGELTTAGFSLVQHSRDLVLFKLIKDYWGYGTLVEENNREVVRLRVEKFQPISEELIPFFIKNSL